MNSLEFLNLADKTYESPEYNCLSEEEKNKKHQKYKETWLRKVHEETAGNILPNYGSYRPTAELYDSVTNQAQNRYYALQQHSEPEYEISEPDSENQLNNSSRLVKKVYEIKNSDEYKSLPKSYQDQISKKAGDKYRNLLLSSGQSIEPVDYNAQSDAYNQTVANMAESLFDVKPEPADVSHEAKDITLGNAAKAGLKSMGRGVLGLAPTMAGAAGFAANTVGMDNVGEFFTASSDAMEQGINNLLPAEQTQVTNIDDILERSFGQNFLSVLDAAPEQIFTFVMPAVLGMGAAKATQLAKAGRIGGKFGKYLAKLNPRTMQKFGAFVGSSALEGQDINRNIYRELGRNDSRLATLGGSMLAGAAESVVPGGLEFTGLGLKSATRKAMRSAVNGGFGSFSKFMTKRVGKSFLEEATTEFIQTCIERSTSNIAKSGELGWQNKYNEMMEAYQKGGGAGLWDYLMKDDATFEAFSAAALGGLTGGLGEGLSTGINTALYNGSPMARFDKRIEDYQNAIASGDKEKLLAADKNYNEYARQDYGVQAAEARKEAIRRAFEDMNDEDAEPEDLRESFEVIAQMTPQEKIGWLKAIYGSDWSPSETYKNHSAELEQYLEDRRNNLDNIFPEQKNKRLKKEIAKDLSDALQRKLAEKLSEIPLNTLKDELADIEGQIKDNENLIRNENEPKVILARKQTLSHLYEKRDMVRGLIAREEARINAQTVVPQTNYFTGSEQQNSATPTNTSNPTTGIANNSFITEAQDSSLPSTSRIVTTGRTQAPVSTNAQIDMTTGRPVTTAQVINQTSGGNMIANALQAKAVRDAERQRKNAAQAQQVEGATPDRDTSLPSYLDSLYQEAEKGGFAPETADTEEDPDYNNALNALFTDEINDIAGNNSTEGTTLPDGRGYVGRQAKLRAQDLDTTCHYAVVEADDLKEDPNNSRARGERAASDDQIRSIADNLNPDLLIDNSIMANDGPIVIGEDMIVESGNGRMKAIQMAYADQSGEGEYSGSINNHQYGKASQYRNAIVRRAAEFGISPKQVAAMKHPVLVRIRDNNSSISRQEFGIKSNTSRQMAMSATEQALVDAEKIKPYLFKFKAVSDIDADSNREFVRDFLGKVCSPGELNDMYTKDRKMLSANGRQRIMNALFAVAFRNSEVLSSLTEYQIPEVQTILNGIIGSIGDAIKLKGEAQQNKYFDIDFSDDLASAIMTIRDIKLNADLSKQASNSSLAETYFRQSQFADDGKTPEARLLIGVLGNLRSKEAITEFMRDCYAEVRAHGDPNQRTLDGSLPALSNLEVIEGAIRRSGIAYKDGTLLADDIERFKKGPSSLMSQEEWNNLKFSLRDKNDYEKIASSKQIAEQEYLEAKGIEEDIDRQIEESTGLAIDSYNEGNQQDADDYSEYTKDLYRQSREAASRRRKAELKNNQTPTVEQQQKIDDEYERGLRESEDLASLIDQLDETDTDTKDNNTTNTTNTTIKREELDAVVYEYNRNLASDTDIYIEVYDSPQEYNRENGLSEEKAVPSNAEGMNDEGHVVLFRNNIRDIKHARRKLLHEVIGHTGIKKLLGVNYRYALDGLVDLAKRDKNVRKLFKTIANIYQPYIDGQKNPQSKRDYIFEEVGAFLAEKHDDQRGIVRRFLDRIRLWCRNTLRNYGFNIKADNLELTELFNRSQDIMTESGKWKQDYGATAAQIYQKGDRRFTDNDYNPSKDNNGVRYSDKDEYQQFYDDLTGNSKLSDNGNNRLGEFEDAMSRIDELERKVDRKNTKVIRSVSKVKVEIPRDLHGNKIELVTENLGTNTYSHEALIAARKQAVANNQTLRKICEYVANKTNSEVEMRKEPKRLERAEEKRKEDYSGDAARVVDFIGGTIIVNQDGDFAEVIDCIRNSLPDGVTMPKVKPFGWNRDTDCYQDIKISLRFPNGGIGEVIVIDNVMFQMKMKNGGHTIYDITKILEKYKDNDKEVFETYKKFQRLDKALYNRNGYDSKEFERLKAIASDSLTRLTGHSNASISDRDIGILNSSSSKLYLCIPYSDVSYATLDLSEMKNPIRDTSDSGDNSVSPSTSSITKNSRDGKAKYSVGADSDEIDQFYNDLTGDMPGTESDPFEDFDRYMSELGEPSDKPQSKFSLAGINAETADIAKLEKARNLLADGMDRKEVWKKTGWYKGKDGKFRFEISDLNLKLKDQFRKIKRDLDKKSGVWIVKLGEIISHQKLFKAYPEMRILNVAITNEPDSTYGGRYTYKEYSDGLREHELHLNLGKDYNKTYAGIKETITHEIQHYIQQIEGFAKGSTVGEELELLHNRYSPNVILSKLNGPGKELAKKYMEVVRERNKYDWNNEETYYNHEALKVIDEITDIQHRFAREQMLELAKEKPEILDDPDYFEKNLTELCEPLRNLEKGMDIEVKNDFPDSSHINEARENYRKQYGETEARAVGKRSGYWDNKNLPYPEDDFDVSAKDTNVRLSLGRNGRSDNEYKQLLLDFENGYNTRGTQSGRRLEFDFDGQNTDDEYNNLYNQLIEDTAEQTDYYDDTASDGRENIDFSSRVLALIPDIQEDINEYEENLVGYEELPAGLEAYRNIFDGEEIADIDSALMENDYQTALNKLMRIRNKCAKTFYPPLADRLVRSMNAAINAVRTGEIPDVMDNFTFYDFADVQVRRLPHSAEEEKGWRMTGAAYRHNRRYTEPTKSNNRMRADYARYIREQYDNDEISEEERRSRQQKLRKEVKREWDSDMGDYKETAYDPYNDSTPKPVEDEYTRMRHDMSERSNGYEDFMLRYPDYAPSRENAGKETNNDRRKRYGSADRFKPRWSLSEKTLRNLSREDTDTITQRAVEELGTTDIWEGAGYLMPDGRLLDFSESNDGGIEGERSMDHRQIGRFYDYVMDNAREEATAYLVDFMNRGNIRCQNGGFELSQKPTYEQRETLRRFIAEHNDEPIYVDFAAPDGRTEHSVTYEGEEPSRILADISRYYDDGLKPEGTDTESRWSINSNSDSDQREDDIDSESESLLVSNNMTKATSKELPYYAVPFAKKLSEVIKPDYTDRNHVFVSETPEVLQKIGFERLPIMMPLRKVRLNYYDDDDFIKNFGHLKDNENTHNLRGNLTKIPNAIKNPIAILGNFAQSAKDGSIVVLTDINANGSKVIVPIIIESETTADGDRIDSHVILTIYDKKDWLNSIIKPAIKEENEGRIGVFYLNKEKASGYNAFSQLKGRITSDFLHKITDDDSSVNNKFKIQTETRQFKRWFGDSVMTEDGKPGSKPKVFYHGSPSDSIDEYNKNKSFADEISSGNSIWFTDNRKIADEYYAVGKNKKTYEDYLSVKHPLIIDAKNSPWNQVETDLLPKNKYYNPVTKGYNETNKHSTDEIAEWAENNGYDGVVFNNLRDGSIYAEPSTVVAIFNPRQAKSATDNIGTFDGNNSKRYYSLSDQNNTSDNDYLAAEENGDKEAELDKALDRRFGKFITPEQRQALHDMGFDYQDVDEPIPTPKEEFKSQLSELATAVEESFEGFLGDTRSVKDRQKPDYLWHRQKQGDHIETEFEMTRRNNIEKAMKARSEEDRLILQHLDADKNYLVQFIRDHTKPGALQDWLLKKTARILGPFQAMKPIENILYTICENLMWDEQKQKMVIAPQRIWFEDKEHGIAEYRYEANDNIGRQALKYYNKLNPEFRAIVEERAKVNNEFRKDFCERVKPLEKAKLLLAIFARRKLNGAGEKILEGSSRIAHAAVSSLQGIVDRVDYNALRSDLDYITNIPEAYIGRNADNINKIIANLTGTQSISIGGLQKKLEILSSNNGIYGYVHHHMLLDPETKSGGKFNALGKLGHPWLEVMAADRKARKGDGGQKSLLLADVARNEKEATAEAANRWMADAEDQRGIPVEAVSEKNPLPGGYKKEQKVIANFGKWRGKEIYLPDELFDTYQLIRKKGDLTAGMEPFSDVLKFIDNANSQINQALLYAPAKAARDLIAVPFALTEFLRDWSIKHPNEAVDALKAVWQGIRNSASPEYWQSHTPESMGEYSESLTYDRHADHSRSVKFANAIGNIFQKSVPVGSTLAAMLGELNLSGAADIPLKRILTTVGETLADKRGLKGNDRSRFIYDIMNEYAFDTSDLPPMLAYFRGQYPKADSQAWGMISRMSVPFFGYTSRMLKQMITDPVRKGMIPLAKRTIGRGYGLNSSLNEEFAHASRPFFWLALHALLASGLAGILPPPLPQSEEESAAANIQDAPGLDSRARTQGRMYIGADDKSEKWLSVKGFGQLETADTIKDFATGRVNDIRDFAAEFLTLHPIITTALNAAGIGSAYDMKIPFGARTGRTLAQVLLPEFSRFGPDLAKLLRIVGRSNTIPDNQKQNFFSAFFEQLGLPVGAVQYDRDGKLRTSDTNLESLKMMGLNIRDIPFDVIENAAKTEMSRIKTDTEKLEKINDYKAGKYSGISEKEFLKNYLKSDFATIRQAEDYYSDTRKREAKLVDTAVKLNKKGYWTDPEEEKRRKAEERRELRELTNPRKQKKGNISRRKKAKKEKKWLSPGLNRINQNINKGIQYGGHGDEYEEFLNDITGGRPSSGTASAAEQLEELLNQL